MSNPFSMRAMDLSSGMNALGQGLMARQNRNEMAAQQEQQQALMKQAGDLYRAGDMDAIFEFSVANPTIGKNILDTLNAKTGMKQDEVLGVTKQILANPEGTEQLLTDRISMITERGGDPKDTVAQLEAYRSDPEGFIKGAEILLGFSDKEAAEQYRAAQPKKQGSPYTGTPQYDKDGNPYMLNKNTGRMEMVPGGFVKGASKPQTVVNVGKAEGEQAKTIAKAEGERYNSYVSDAAAALKNDATLSRLAGLNDKAFSGAGAGAYKTAAKLGSALGIETEGLTETELFDSLSNRLVLGQTSQLTGVLTDKDMDLLASTVPQLSQTKEGRKQLIKVMQEVNSATKDKAKLAAKFRKENNGQFDDMEFQSWLDTQPKDDRLSFLESASANQSVTPMQAPQGALSALQADPQLAEQFKAKYGYLPEGM